MKNKIKALVDQYEEKSVTLRRHFHRHPEVSGQEYETARFIKEEWIAGRLPIHQMTETGFIAILDSGRPGPTLGLRTELDALPIEEHEMNLNQPRLVRSENKGSMHACGHDGHLAILLTTMDILIQLKAELCGRVIFIFEEAEETTQSVKELIEGLKDYHLDAVYGNHLYSGLDTGKVVVSEGPVMSGAARVDFSIYGQSGHASRPDQAVNPIFAGAAILNDLSIAWNNQRDITKTVSLGITQFHSGHSWNIIEEQADIVGTLRFFDEDEAIHALDLIKNIATTVGQAHQCRLAFDPSMDRIFLPTINDSVLAQVVQASLEKMDSPLQAVQTQWFASETFSEYRKLCPTHFTLVGTRNEEIGSGAAHHNEHFDLDEGSLKGAIHLMSQFAADYLNEGEK